MAKQPNLVQGNGGGGGKGREDPEQSCNKDLASIEKQRAAEEVEGEQAVHITGKLLVPLLLLSFLCSLSLGNPENSPNVITCSSCFPS